MTLARTTGVMGVAGSWIACSAVLSSVQGHASDASGTKGRDGESRPIGSDEHRLPSCDVQVFS